MKLRTNEIKIPNGWKSYSESKYLAKEKKYLSTGKLGKIVVDCNGTLLDGYLSYLILKNHGAEEIEVYVQPRHKRVYVTGTHPNSPCLKSYTWEVPHNMVNGFISKTKPGSRIYCETKFGIAPVIVERIFSDNKDMGVKFVKNY